MTTPRLGAPELVSGQATPETTVNEQIRYIEAGAGHFIFKDRDLIAPPGSPSDGDCYFIAAGTTPTGDWAGKAGKIAFRVSTAWEFITPIDGFTAVVVDESRLLVGYNSGTQVWDSLSSPSGAYQPLDSDLTAIAGLVDPNADRILFWDDSAGSYAYLTAGTGLTITGTTLDAAAGSTEATDSEVWTGTSTTTRVTPRRVFTAAAEQTLTDGATVTPDFNAGLNFKWTIGGNRTLANPTNAKSGQSGVIVITQDATGSRVISYGTNWKFPGGAAAGGVLSTAANAVDVLNYFVRADGTILTNLSKAYS